MNRTRRAGTVKFSSRLLRNVQQFHLEYQGGIGRDYPAGSRSTIAQLRWDDQLALSSDFHGHNPFVPAGDKVMKQQAAEWGRANGVEGMRIVDASAVRAREPNIVGHAAIEVPSTGIVLSEELVKAYARVATDQGASIVPHAKVSRLTPAGDCIRVTSEAGEIEARCVVNCAGLFADEVAALLNRPLIIKVAPLAEIQDLLKKSESSQRMLDEATEGFKLDLIREDETGEETITIEKKYPLFTKSGWVVFMTSIVVMTWQGSECGGRTLVESPECTPASSMCCMTPPMTAFFPSQTRSTSTSMARSRN